MTYSEKLKDPRWQKKRLEILSRDEWKCCECGNKEEMLHVHHKVYFKKTDPWDYDSVFLTTLCETCHDRWHEAKSQLDKRLAYLNYGDMYRLSVLLINVEAFQDLASSICQIGDDFFEAGRDIERHSFKRQKQP